MFQVAFVCDRGYLKQQSLVETKTDVVSCYAAEAQLLRLFAALFEAYHRSSEMKWFTRSERLLSLDGLFFFGCDTVMYCMGCDGGSVATFPCGDDYYTK